MGNGHVGSCVSARSPYRAEDLDVLLPVQSPAEARGKRTQCWICSKEKAEAGRRCESTTRGFTRADGSSDLSDETSWPVASATYG